MHGVRAAVEEGEVLRAEEGGVMGNYSTDAASVRVDFFKPSGKWYTTEAVVWTRYHGTDHDGKITLLDDAFREALAEHLQKHSIKSGRCQHCGRSDESVNGATYCEKAPSRLRGMTAVCLDPYHEQSVPLLVVVPGSYES